MRMLNIKNVLGPFWLIKIILFPVFLILCLSIFSYLNYFYSKQLDQNSSQQQLFFLALDQYGVSMPLFYYIHCWTNLRGRATIVVFTPQIKTNYGTCQTYLPNSRYYLPLPFCFLISFKGYLIFFHGIMFLIHFTINF